MLRKRRGLASHSLIVAAVVAASALPARGVLNLGPERLVQSGGAEIAVSGYSVPSYADMNGDGVKDLIVGEGSGAYTPKVRIYANTGTAAEPQFAGFDYAQSEGADLTVPGSGCLGLFPRAVYWDNDPLRDLLVGLADGTVKVYLNVGTAQEPAFDGGSFVQVGEVGSKVNIDVGYRATPTLVDWDNDTRLDLVIGALDGRGHVYFNCGCSLEMPEFILTGYAQEDGSDLYVPTARSSPEFVDLDGDGLKDLLTGNTAGELLFYHNVGFPQFPGFSGFTAETADGVAIDLPGDPRSRPSVCDWTGDGLLDVLIGAGDGKVRLYRGRPHPGDANADGAVDGADYTAWADCYGDLPVPGWSDGGWTVGNFNEDDTVDGADYTAWADQYGYGTTQAQAPEPTALLLTGLGGVGLLLRRRH